MALSDSSGAWIRPCLPPAVARCVARVRATGGRVLLVGGAVRDALLGDETRDYDFATSLEPLVVRALFADVVEFDERLGTCRLRCESHDVVFTTFREEGDYRDHRHPRLVRFVVDPRRDAVRRDFTVNAIYLDPHDGRLLDPCGGIADLERRLLRTIGEPARRFAEDPLRMLRAVRFAARGGMKIEPATLAALRARAPLLAILSAERTFDELCQAFTGRRRGLALRLLVDCGLADELLPEVVEMIGVEQPPEYHPEGDVLTHTCLVLDHVEGDDPVQAWAAVLHDTGKPATFVRAPDRIRFHGHDVRSAAIASNVLERLRAPRRLREAVVDLCRQHIRFASILQMARAKRERWMRMPSFGAHLAFHRADCLASHGDLALYERVRELARQLPPAPPPPLCTGRDVLALGVPEGPLVGEILRELQGQLEARDVADRPTALRLLAALVAGRIKGES